MDYDLSAATDFMATHARILDRRRFALLIGDGDGTSVLAALAGYRNSDGGYGWGLEPDLRPPESQPGAAHHAFEVFEEIAPATAPEAAALCDWLDSITYADGGMPFALPLGLTAGSGPWWTAADRSTSSLQLTCVTAAAAHRVAAHDRTVAQHPWLERATEYCLTAIAALWQAPFAYVLEFAVRLLDALHDTLARIRDRPRARRPPSQRSPPRAPRSCRQLEGIIATVSSVMNRLISRSDSVRSGASRAICSRPR
jgi:hypothetical protein